jgi:hypothetical protein
MGKHIKAKGVYMEDCVKSKETLRAEADYLNVDRNEEYIQGIMGHPSEELMGDYTWEDRPTHDKVNHPSHYLAHPSGVECITITEHFNFCIGNAIKYLWRSGLKENAVEDLRKSIWYIEREIERITND